MARSSTRAGRAATQYSQSSQSQPRGSRRARRGADPEDEDDGAEESGQEDGEQDMDMEPENMQSGPAADIMRKANDLVRLALFAEQKRGSLRRDEITKKILGGNARLFNRVFDIAQATLKTTFAMELVELRTRAAIKTENMNGNEDLDEARQATGVRKRAVNTGSKTYILRSTLDPLIIQNASQTSGEILEEESADAPEEDDDDAISKAYGGIIAWNSADQLGPVSILYVILALILGNGRSISDMDLRSYLKQLHLSPTASVSFSARSTHRSLTLDAFLIQLIKQGYLDRIGLGDPKNVAGGKRGRGTTQSAEDGAIYEWRWGPRAFSEVGEKGVAQFMAEFMVQRSTDGEDEDEDEGGRGNRGNRGARGEAHERKVEKMLKSVERAAGGNLSEPL